MTSGRDYAIVAAGTPGRALDLLDTYLRADPKVIPECRDSVANSVHVNVTRDSGMKSTLEGVIFPFDRHIHLTGQALEKALSQLHR